MSGNKVVFNDNTSNNMKEINIDVWVNNPTVLLDKNTLFEIWPTQQMCYERKINAMSRLIIILTILGFILTRSVKILIVGLITLIVIYLFYYQNWYKNNKEAFNSGIDSESSSEYVPIVNVNTSEKILNPNTTSISINELPINSENGTPLNKFMNENYYKSTPKNPLGNVLLTDINDNPDRPSAPPAFNTLTSNDIRKNIKKAVQLMNPGIKCSEKQLYNNLYDNFDLDQSNRVFNATPNTRIANDQGAFAHWLYDNTKFSGKENTPEGAIARVQDNAPARYIDP